MPWPASLLIVRHGESAGNVARDTAEASGAELIALDQRDVDVELSALGRRQAESLGRWLARLPNDERPTVALSSPYVRAQQTATVALEAAGLDAVPLVLDERLREREFGVLDRLTKAGILARHPDQAELRRFIGKFFHRPPGGESWADVAQRVRGVLVDLRADLDGERVLLGTHQVVVLAFRYVLEGLTEADVLGISDRHPVANCSVTTYRYDAGAGRRGGLALAVYGVVAPLEEAGVGGL